MKKTAYTILTALVVTGLTGCANMDPTGISQLIHANEMGKDQKVIQQRTEITTKFNQSPDTDTWNDQRKKLQLARGERVFDKDFGRVFDSLVVALGNLELTVKNMERTSGYISASGITLPPTESKQMYREAVNEWCKQNNYDSSILDQKLKTEEMRNVATMIDSAGMMGKYEKMQRGLTFQLNKMSDAQTKVKLRFSDVYYPGEIEAYYKLVWAAVDKQVFIDNAIDGKTEKRE